MLAWAEQACLPPAAPGTPSAGFPVSAQSVTAGTPRLQILGAENGTGTVTHSHVGVDQALV